MQKQASENPLPSPAPFILMSLTGAFVAWISWENRAGLGSSVWLPLLMGLLFAGAGMFAAVWSRYISKFHGEIKQLPAAPAQFDGAFAPDFRRNLEHLHAALPDAAQELTLEPDYAFWYNGEQSLELVLTPEGWMAFFVLHAGGGVTGSETVARAVADSPFAQHPVAQELGCKYADLPLSGVAWCTADRLVVYPAEAAEDFTRFYAGNLFAPAAVFDEWLKFYLETGEMQE